MLSTEGGGAPDAHIKTFLAVLKFFDRMVEIADATTCGVGLARGLAVKLEEFAQRLYHILELVRTGVRSFYSC